MDVAFAVLNYLDRCERTGRQETFSNLAEALYSEGATPEEVFQGIRWLFSSSYAARTRPNQFVLTDRGLMALEEFRDASATRH